MSDCLQRGAERFEKDLCCGEKCRFYDGQLAQQLAADSGVRALVESCQLMNDTLILHGVIRKEMPGDIYVAWEGIAAALKLWEHGK